MKDLTKGKVSTQLVVFSLPFLLSNLIQSLYNIVDLLIIERYGGTTGVSGVAIGGQITMVVTYVIIGLCGGGTILVAQYIGMKKKQDVKESIGTLFSVLMFAAVAVTFVIVLFSNPLLRLINTPVESFDKAKDYLVICMMGTFFIFGYNAISAVLRGIGDSKTPLVFVSIACLINVVLDLIFIRELKMDAAGAALATVISQGFSMFLAVLHLYRKKFIFDFRWKSFRIVPEKAKIIFRLGIPGSVQNLIVSGGFLMVSSITNSFGVTASSAVAFSMKVNQFAQMPAQSISAALSTMVGQNIGAGLIERAKRSFRVSILLAIGVGVIAFTLVQAMPEAFLSIFTSDPFVIKEAVPYLRITSFDYLLVALIFPLNGFINGSGHTVFTMIPSIVSSVIIRVPVAFLFAKVLGLDLFGVGISTPAGTVSAIVICLLYYRSEAWEKVVI